MSAESVLKKMGESPIGTPVVIKGMFNVTAVQRASCISRSRNNIHGQYERKAGPGTVCSSCYYTRDGKVCVLQK